MAEPGSIGEVYARNRAGDLDYVPVEQPDTSTWLERVYGMLRQGITGEAQPGQRGGLFPSRINEQGQVELAAPEIALNAADVIQNLPRVGFSEIMRDPDGNRDVIRKLAEGSFDFASMLPAAGVAAGRTIPEGAAGIFGGRLAKTADQSALKRAEDMAAKGAPREDIWNQTGWFKGVDGKWRFEIDDSGAAMKYPAGDLAGEVAKVMGVTGGMGDIFSHPNAYAAYPDTAAIPGDIGLFRKGTYYVSPSKGKEQISVNAKDAERVPHTLHEFQHAIQDREGFGRGASVAGLRQQLQGRVPDNWLRDDVLMRAYARTAGEVESRAVESRAKLTADERRARPPWLDYDVPENQQIVRLASNADDPNTAAILAAMQGQERPRSLPQVEQTWGPKWDVLMGQQYRMAEAGGDLSTQYDILKAKLSKASGIDPEMRAAMEAKAQELAAEMGVEGRKAAGISANPDDPTTAAILALLTQQEKPSAGLVGKAKGARPEPDALIPKAEAMGADVAPQGKSSGSVAETAATDYTQFVRSLQDDPQSEPTVGMPTPGVDQSAVRAAYENGLRRWHSGFGKHATEAPDPLGSLDGPLGKDLGAVMDSLRAAAKVAGRDLEVLPRSYGSQYGHLKTPTGDAWKVRVADHGNQSRHRAESDFNIAPGQMTVEEFLGLLPRIYANSSDPTTAAILALLTAQQQGGQPQQ